MRTPMLVGQAAAAMPLFGVGECTDKAFENALSVLKRQEENIVLIGMPGSGKSTVGKLLAKELGRELVDTDEMVISRTDKSMAVCTVVGRNCDTDTCLDVERCVNRL